MFLIILVLVLILVYLAFKTDKLLRIEVAAAQSLENRLSEFEGNFQKILPNTAAYGWYDDGWPSGKTEEESRCPLANPGSGDTNDEFAKQLRIAEYLSIQCGRDRVDFLRALKREGQGMTENFLDMVYSDKSAFVRAWAAAHLDLVLNELPEGAADLERPWEALVERRNFRTLLLADPEPIVRGAVWSNPDGGRYSGMIRVHEGWQEEFGNMSQLERLGLMRNPELSRLYVLELLKTPSQALHISREEHAQVLCEAARNPNIISGSRATGRKDWGYKDCSYGPSEEYGRMWDLCQEWIDQSSVTHLFLKYVQTTPSKKLEVYNRFLKSDEPFLRKDVIASCDPLLDKSVLKAAWSDPNEDCRTLAEKRVGRYTKQVGVKRRRNE